MRKHSRSRGSCRFLAVAVASIAAAAAVPMAAAQSAQAAQAAQAPPRPATLAPTAKPGTSPPAPAPRSPGLLSATQAAAKARATGKPVVASALISPTSLTTVRPNGISTVTQTLRPTRAWRGGTWHALNPDLSRGLDHTVTPAVTANGLVLSGGGGSRPLVVMDNHGRTLSLRWPAPLPAPSLSGATATYAGVLPGVNLVVTVSPQGGLTEVLIVGSAAAAANPALTRLVLRASAPGLRLTAGADGSLRVTASAAGRPVFNAPPARMWDSALPAAGTRTEKGPGGTILAVPSGLPAFASAAGPGTGSRVARVPLSVSGGTITLSPPRAALTGRAITYPLYIDPSFQPDPVNADAANWTQVDSGYPGSTYWDEGSNLQVGLCDWSGCGGIGTVRSYFTMPIPSQITSGVTLDYAYLYMTNVWSASCPTGNAEPISLHGVSGISSSTDWYNQPGWGATQTQSFAFGCNGYTANNVAWNITANVHDAQVNGWTSHTFGMSAGTESNDVQWKQFLSGAANIWLTIAYHSPPSQPANLQTAPAGACQTSYATKSLIGNDDITLAATIGDVDNNFGDGALNTTFTVYSYDTGDVVYSATIPSNNAVGGVPASVTIPRATVQSWAEHGDGSITPYSYYWNAVTSDTGSPVLTGPTSATCYFQYQPLAPGPPTATFPNGTTAPLGATIEVTFRPYTTVQGTTTCSSTGGANPCPVSYTYQAGVAAPVTVTPNNQPAAGDYTGLITVSQVGVTMVSVYGTDPSGNRGQAGVGSGYEFTGTKPASAYPDGYYTGGGYPSVLTTGAGSHASLWLSAGTGNGTLGTPVDIGSIGTSISSTGIDGPGDWAGAQVLHGDFFGDGVEDIMAYYPNTGAGALIAGSGAAVSLQPAGRNEVNVPVGVLADDSMVNPVTDTADNPVTLVAAGNASEYGAVNDDIIASIGDPGSDYVLDLFSTSGNCLGFSDAGGYSYCTTLSGAEQAPDPADLSWRDYTLTTAELPDTAHPHGDPSNIALFALNTKDGTLYETTNPNWSSPALATSTPVGSATALCISSTPSGTPCWNKLAVPWGSTAPSIVSADTGNGGQTELWTLSGATATPYVLSGTTVSPESSGATTISYPGNEWPVTDGSDNLHATSATDLSTATGQPAALSTSGATWNGDDYFGEDIQLNPAGGGALATAGPVINTTGSYTVSAWAKLSYLPSVNETVVAQDGTTASGFYLMYNIYCGGCWELEFANTDTTYPGFAASAKGPLAQPGVWTNLVAVYNATTKTAQLYVDGTLAGSTSYTAWSATGPFTIGRDKYNGSPDDYLAGSIADVQTWNNALTAAQVASVYR